MIGVIARHEAMSLLRSAQTWLLAAILALLCGYLFLRQLETFIGVQDQLALQDYPVGLSGFMSTRYLQPLSVLFSFVAPLLAMRAFSEEFRQNTYALWQSSPVSSVSLVLGKFTGLCLLMSLFVGVSVAMLLVMRVYIPIDLPLVLFATMGLLLCSFAAVACGMYFSSLTQHSMIAIVASLATLTVLWLLGSANFGELPLQPIRNLSMATHLSGFFQGFLQTASLAYFALGTALFLALTVIRLDALRQNGY